MPAPAPLIDDAVAAKLAALGERIRAHRKALRVSATSAAEAAGMSRVTLHRIERGEASVAMGAYISVASALGLELAVVDPQDRSADDGAKPTLPSTIRLTDFPQLKRLAWQLGGETELTPKQALELYERNWKHVDRDAMTASERTLVDALIRELGGGRLLV